MEKLSEQLNDVLDNTIDFISQYEQEIIDKSIEFLSVVDNCDINHLKELIQADKEGRCAVLPCKVGNVLYTNVATPYMKKKDRPYPIEVCYIGLNEKSGYFNVIYKNKSTCVFSFEEIGKYVFLTKQEAEQALKERGNK